MKLWQQQGETTMRTTGSVLVAVIWFLTAGTMATDCGQTSQVTVSPTNPVWGQYVTVTCIAPCSLSDKTNTFIWYLNGQRLDNLATKQFSNFSYYTHSFSCDVNGSENLRSPVVCILGNSCYNVTYANQTMVVSKGSTVDLFCTYQHPYNHTVIETTWYIKQEGDEVPTDLRSLPEYSGRVKYLGNNISDCSLRITDLRESDSAEYKFRFKGQFNGNSNLEWGYSFTGITLTVSDPDRVTKIIAVVGTIVFILVFIFCLSGFLWFRKKASTNRTTDTVDNKQRASNPVYDTAHGEVVTPNAEQDPHDKADVHYASVHIARSKNQVEPLYSVAQPVRPNKQEEDVQYAAVKFNCPSAATR